MPVSNCARPEECVTLGGIYDVSLLTVHRSKDMIVGSYARPQAVITLGISRHFRTCPHQSIHAAKMCVGRKIESFLESVRN